MGSRSATTGVGAVPELVPAVRTEGIEAMSALRRYVTPLAVIAAAILFYMENPWVSPTPEILPYATVAFWVLSIGVIVLLFEDRKQPSAKVVEVEGPAFSRYLFSNTRAGLLWLPIRIFLGFEWITAGWHKASGGGWLDGGSALHGFWTSIVAVPKPPAHAAITFTWYADFINGLLSIHAWPWFAYVITFGEMAVGIGLLVGALTGVAAFFGATMSMSFELAGSTSVNPIMFALAVGLILAWRVAGYYGIDRYLLPLLGVPWRKPVTEHLATRAATGVTAIPI
jgi:thiosulfate dehydrogenase [quinone] large subunit